MKNLLLRLSPFAPDQSGVVAMLFELGGLTVICDAGGCTGNICGFDEPRWRGHKSALFSAGLRDMDAILGRDERLLENLRAAVAAMQPRPAFVALVGTPVPAVIATDFAALKRLGEEQNGLPVLALATTGAAYYDAGVQAVLMQLCERFVGDRSGAVPGRVGLLAATPLDLSLMDASPLRATLRAQGFNDIRAFGMGAGLEALSEAGTAAENLVLSPAGLAAAKYLQQRFGTPWRAFCPLPRGFAGKLAGFAGKKVLVVHQQVMANSIRTAIRETGGTAVVATWFMLAPELAEPGDLHLESEADFAELAVAFDAVVADRALAPAAGKFAGEWLDLPHFAVSGRLLPGRPDSTGFQYEWLLGSAERLNRHHGQRHPTADEALLLREIEERYRPDHPLPPAPKGHVEWVFDRKKGDFLLCLPDRMGPEMPDYFRWVLRWRGRLTMVLLSSWLGGPEDYPNGRPNSAFTYPYTCCWHVHDVQPPSPPELLVGFFRTLRAALTAYDTTHPIIVPKDFVFFDSSFDPAKWRSCTP